MVEAFSQTEIPHDDIDHRRHYVSQITQTKAAVKVSNAIRHALRPQAYADLPDDLRRFNDEAGLNKETITNRALVWPLKVLELLVSNNEQARDSLEEAKLVESLNEILVLNGWGESSTQQASESSSTIILVTVRILATLMVREEAQRQFIGPSVQSVIALVNLMKDSQRQFNSEVDRIDLITNGLKILRIVTNEKNIAVKISDDYNMCLKHVLDILEQHVYNRVVKEEGREVVTNITRYQIVSEELKRKIQSILGQGQKLAQPSQKPMGNGLAAKIQTPSLRFISEIERQQEDFQQLNGYKNSYKQQQNSSRAATKQSSFTKDSKTQSAERQRTTHHTN